MEYLPSNTEKEALGLLIGCWLNFILLVEIPKPQVMWVLLV